MQVLTAAQRRAIKTLLAEQLDCDAFDGGCLVFAAGLQKAVGGAIEVIVGSREGGPRVAHHAVVRLPDGRVADADGAGTESEVTARFIRNECPLGLANVSVRPIAVDDLPDAARDERVAMAIAAILRQPAALRPAAPRRA